MPSRKSRLRAPIQVPASVVAARATAGARTMADVTICRFAGVDWGSQRHQACVLDAAGKVVGERAFPHGGAGLAALCDWLMSMAGNAGAVAVTIEVPHGPVVDALLDRGFAVHAINPKQLDRLRDRVRGTAHGPAPVPARRGRRPGCDRAAGVVALSRGATAGAG